MSARTVVGIEPGMDSLLVKLLKAPSLIGRSSAWQPFQCTPEELPEWTSAEAVKARGRVILDRLNQHPDVQQALAALLQAPPGETRALYFRVMRNDAERLCWETLCAPDDVFLALDRRWPIARIADSVLDRGMAVRFVQPPLRILALISAAQIAGQEREYEALKRSIVDARAAGLEVEMLVLSGHDEVLAAVENDVQNGLAGVSAKTMPASRMDLEDQISAYAPHVLHFFCHGRTGHALPRLELATRVDAMAGNAHGSLTLDVDQFKGIPALESVWLVTLNCCQGAQPSQNLFSIAYDLVAAGVPAAVGMLEEVDADDAHEFCGRFYPALLRQLRETLAKAQGGQDGELDWAATLHASRSALCQRHLDDPKNNRQWALPVLYVRPEPFLVRVNPGAIPPDELRTMRERAEEVAAALRALPPETPAAIRDQLLAIVDDVPEWMRPDPQGQFAGDGTG